MLPFSLPHFAPNVCLNCMSLADSSVVHLFSLSKKLSIQEYPRPTSPQSITPNKALRAVLFSTEGSVTRVIRPTHAGLACSLSSSSLLHSCLPQDSPMSLKATPTLLVAIPFSALTIPKL
uniref:ANAPC4_WD40 domain-containing protein n=1 Tax=Mesocestoides corti TaxID=53468 RepID=A0A5K3EMV7_MESCO